MKKLVCSVMALIMVVGLCACGSKAAYTIHVVDEAGTGIKDVRVQMCDDSSCTNGMTDDAGTVLYEKDVPSLEVHILSAPEGYAVDKDAVYSVDAQAKELTITLSAE